MNEAEVRREVAKLGEPGKLMGVCQRCGETKRVYVHEGRDEDATIALHRPAYRDGAKVCVDCMRKALPV